METAEPPGEGFEYEPPPHVFARLGGAAVGLVRFATRDRSRWNASWVGQTAFAALGYAYLSPILGSHLPVRFGGYMAWVGWMEWDLVSTARRSIDEFLRLALRYGAFVVLIGPLREELAFRGAPILLARSVGRRASPFACRTVALTIAVASTLLFAWLHVPIVGFLPVPQLLFGALAWSVAYRRGLRYSLLLHVLTNLIFFGELVARIASFVG